MIVVPSKTLLLELLFQLVTTIYLYFPLQHLTQHLLTTNEKDSFQRNLFLQQRRKMFGADKAKRTS